MSPHSDPECILRATAPHEASARSNLSDNKKVETFLKSALEKVLNPEERDDASQNYGIVEEGRVELVAALKKEVTSWK